MGMQTVCRHHPKMVGNHLHLDLQVVANKDGVEDINHMGQVQLTQTIKMTIMGRHTINNILVYLPFHTDKDQAIKT